MPDMTMKYILVIVSILFVIVSSQEDISYTNLLLKSADLAHRQRVIDESFQLLTSEITGLRNSKDFGIILGINLHETLLQLRESNDQAISGKCLNETLGLAVGLMNREQWAFRGKDQLTKIMKMCMCDP